jgi:hypothetical protein
MVFLLFFLDDRRIRSRIDPDPYLILMDLYPDLGGPKTYGSYGLGSGSPTLIENK